jgi:hypothetical protein
MRSLPARDGQSNACLFHERRILNTEA